MLLVLDRRGSVIEAHGVADRHEPTWEFAKDGRIVHPAARPNRAAFEQARVYFNHAHVAINNDKMEFIAIPACPQQDVFVSYREGGRIIIATDLFEIAERVGHLTVDPDQKEKFSVKGYCQPGTTFFGEITRLVPAHVYVVRDGVLSMTTGINAAARYRRGRRLTSKETYRLFKDSLASLARHESHGLSNGVMLSGGPDSRLLALLLADVGAALKCYTVKHLPGVGCNLVDVAEAKRAAACINAEHEVVEADFCRYHAHDLDRMIQQMPFAAHLAVNFLTLTDKMRQDGIDKAWCGQNIDNLYNLGPTTRVSPSRAGLMDLVKRYYLSEAYLGSLAGLPSASVLPKEVHRMIGWSGTQVYSLLKGKSYTQPRSAAELIEAFQLSYDNTVFIPEKSALDRASYLNQWTHHVQRSEDIRDILYSDKVHGYLSGGPSRIIHVTTNRSGFSSVLPYASEPLVAVFAHLKQTGIELFQPKRYVYDYIKELGGSYGKDTNVFQPPKHPGINEAPNYHQWAMNVLKTTIFGRELRDHYPHANFPNHFTGARCLQACLVGYWYDTVTQKLMAEGIDIASEHKQSKKTYAATPAPDMSQPWLDDAVATLTDLSQQAETTSDTN